MDIERTLETQRHRLLRIVAGLVVLLGVLAVGPVSRQFSDWVLGFVECVLSRAEAAVQYLVVTQACLMAGQCGLDVKRSQIAMPFAPEWNSDEADVSLIDCRQRLRVLRLVLGDLPRHALRLLRRIARQCRGAGRQLSVRFDLCCAASVHDWHLPANCIERPPDMFAGTLRFIPRDQFSLRA